MQNYFNIRIIGIASIYLTLAISINPIVFISLSVLLMSFYLFFWMRKVLKGNKRIVPYNSENIFVGLKYPNYFFPYIIRMILVISIVLYFIVIKEINYEMIISFILILIFGVVEVYTFIYGNKNNYSFLYLSNESIDYQSDYTNRIYYTDLQNVEINERRNKILLNSKNGNRIKINLKKIPADFKSKILEKIIKEAKLNEASIFQMH